MPRDHEVYLTKRFSVRYETDGRVSLLDSVCCVLTSHSLEAAMSELNLMYDEEFEVHSQ